MADAVVYMPPDTFSLHLPPRQLARLRRLCTVLDPVPWTGASPSADILDRVEILVTGWGSQRLGVPDLDRMPRLKLVAHTAGTVKTLIPPHWLERGVRVVQASAANALPVAEYTLAIILLANKQFWRLSQRYRRDRDAFRRRDQSEDETYGNNGRTIGIVGASRVGRLLIEFLRRHNFKILLADPFVDAAEADALGVERATLTELFRVSDVVTLHQPLLPETRGSIGARELAELRDGALLINTARGGVIDHPALARELASGRISAVLDVTDPEPLPADSPLWDMENVILTPHIAGSMGNEIERMTALTLDELDRFLQGLPLQHELTLDQWARAA